MGTHYVSAPAAGVVLASVLSADRSPVTVYSNAGLSRPLPSRCRRPPSTSRLTLRRWSAGTPSPRPDIPSATPALRSPDGVPPEHVADERH